MKRERNKKMDLSNKICELRKKYGISEERFAELIKTDCRTVKEWQSGEGVPNADELLRICSVFEITADELLSDGCNAKNPYRTLEMQEWEYEWEGYHETFMTEYRQLTEEGSDVSQYKDLFEAAAKLSDGRIKRKLSDVIFEIARTAKRVDGYSYIEPSELDKIKALSDGGKRTRIEKTDVRLKNKIEGAWMGRICGCLLGKPVEGKKTYELHPLLKRSGNFPMHRYIVSDDITDEMIEKYGYKRDWYWADKMECAPSDDDTNYIVLAQLLIERYGRNFTPDDVAKIWTEKQPKSAYCTAERVAYLNFMKGYCPPESATHKNVFREWIGAQIRGDYFGYINPGDPETAAEMAWRDASISHTKNGIYGEMFIAAMIAEAAVCDDITEIIKAGLAQIPKTSRLHESICNVLEWHKNGMSCDECFAKIHKLYDENNSHDWTHTISNAMIVCIALLYGEGDFGKSICLAVQTGFDTDCNGATVGSVLGMRNGIDGIGDEWKKPVAGKLDTTIFGVGRVSIVDMAEKTIGHIEG